MNSTMYSEVQFKRYPVKHNIEYHTVMIKLEVRSDLQLTEDIHYVGVFCD